MVYSHAARRAGRFDEAAERVLQAVPAEVRAEAAEVVRQVYAAMGDDTEEIDCRRGIA